MELCVRGQPVIHTESLASAGYIMNAHRKTEKLNENASLVQRRSLRVSAQRSRTAVSALLGRLFSLKLTGSTLMSLKKE